MEQNNEDATLFESILSVLLIIELVLFVALIIAAIWIDRGNSIIPILIKIFATNLVAFFVTMVIAKFYNDSKNK